MNRTLLRTPEMWEKLEKRKKELDGKCGLCEEIKGYPKDSGQIAIVRDLYPYDVVAEKHSLLVSMRHGSTDTKPLLELAGNLKGYDCIMLNYPDAQSEPDHAHIHLIEWKRG